MAVPGDVVDVLVDAQRLGFIGPGPVEDHVQHALAFTRVVRSYARVLDRTGGPAPSVLDLGSGAGLPGLVVATEWTDCTVTLLDGSERRADFLQGALERLELGRRCRVLAGRAEDLGRLPELRGAFDAVVARSFGTPAVTAECAAPFLRVGGVLVVSEPPEKRHDRWPEDGLALLGMGRPTRVADVFSFEVVWQERLCPEWFSRRIGIPAKRPLF